MTRTKQLAIFSLALGIILLVIAVTTGLNEPTWFQKILILIGALSTAYGLKA